jgi:hypothetical protein
MSQLLSNPSNPNSKYLGVPATTALKPLQNTSFCPISALGSNFNPRNTQFIPVVKIIACFKLDQKYAFFKGLALRHKGHIYYSFLVTRCLSGGRNSFNFQFGSGSFSQRFNHA